MYPNLANRDGSSYPIGVDVSYKIIQGNSVEEIPLEDESVDVVVTSPPFWGLRVYGDSPDELGTESLWEYVEKWGRVSDECWRVLKPDGLMWLNVGDTSSGSGGSGGDYNRGGSKDGKPKWRQGKSGYPKMTWCNVPSKLVETMMGPPDDGFAFGELWRHQRWLLRQTIIWDKGVERPESLHHVRRPRPQHEFIYMMAKDRSHRFYPDNLEETGTVWHFKPNSTGTKGLAPFPDQLAVRCIMPSTAPGDVVLDPFSGSGTVPKCADELGREGIGVDLYVDDLNDG